MLILVPIINGMSDHFSITERHYNIIIEQANVNYPKECGGFIGGVGMDIKAIQPVFNQHLYDKTGTFAITSEDVIRAHNFFAKHNLDYMGVYHTHPKASAMPSQQDLSHIQKYMFIISLMHKGKPDFAAYVVDGRNYERRPLNIITGPVDVVNLTDPKNKNKNTKLSDKIGFTKNKVGGVKEEQLRLQEKLSEMTEENVKYDKFETDTNLFDSGFNTIA
jgi:proteasome lid subunit RPN8/RPN11